MLGGIWLVYFSFGLTIAVMAPLVPRIEADLGLSHAAMGSIMGAWPLVYIAAAVPCGQLMDRLGPRRSLLIAAGIIFASSAARAFASDHLTLFSAVALFGLGGPLISVGAPKTIATWFEGQERGLAMGLYITGPALGSIVALSTTNTLVMPAVGEDWRACMLVFSLVSLAARLAWYVISGRPESRASEQRLHAEASSAQSTTVLALARHPTVRLILLMSVGIFFFNHGLNNWLPELLRHGGMDSALAGLWASLPVAASVVSAIVVPRLATPPRRLPMLIGLFLAAALATLTLHQTAPALLALGFLMQGLARGAMLTITMLLLVELKDVGVRKTGTAGGLFFSAAEIGGVLGPLALGFLYDVTHGFDAALYLLTGVCGLLIGLALLVRRTLPR
jgi:cyanate permease